MEQKRIDPIKTSEHIRETYLRYLNTTFGLKHSELAEQFREIAWQSDGLFRGPILEVAPKYRKGRCLLDLIDEGVLSPEFLDYAPSLPMERVETCLNLNRDLYAHQEQALRKIIGENRNVVVATGTGSGKTESFLLPIIDHLLKERAAGRLGPGVRALLVYPMNALANDQVARLRHLLPPETGITFGRYTGQTLRDYCAGLEAFKQENAGAVPQPNEMFCRQQILGIKPSKAEWPHKDVAPFVGPPHVLLTNFAMLEYLLMRPRDSVLFDGDAGNSWRFLVSDEAHVYAGAQGTEIGYLMRRLKDRVCRSQPGKLLCVATSATIGADDNDSRETIASSFQNLFGERFETEDIVTAQQDTLDTFLSGFEEWGTGGQGFYDALRSCVDLNSSTVEALMQAVRETLLPTEHSGRLSDCPPSELIRQSLEKISEYQDCEGAKEALLFCLLAGDARVRTLIGLYEGHPIPFQEAAARVWEASDDAESRHQSLALLIDLASKARLDVNQPPLLTARYHFFVRSLEGLSICLAKTGGGTSGRMRLSLGRHQEAPDAPGGAAVAFELQACGRCGQHFLRGHLMADGRMVSYPQITRLGEEPKRNDYFVIDLDEVIESPEDEDPLRDAAPPVSGEEDDEDAAQTAQGGSTQLGDVQYLCVRCGFVTDTDTLSCEYCRREFSRDSREWVAVRKVVPANGSVVKTCPGCGARKYSGGSIIRAFSVGDDASGDVLAHSLMTNIPPTSEMASERQDPAEEIASRFRRSVQGVSESQPPQGKRRLLAFSDSRQDAAYFSTYLNRTTHQILHRQLILRAIHRLLHDFPGMSADFDANDLVNPLIAETQSAGLFSASDTAVGKQTEVRKWLNAELAGTQRRHGLEGVGLISWEIKCRDRLLDLTTQCEAGLQEDYGLDAQEFVALLEIFLSELRRQNVLQPLQNVDIRDPYFWPRNRPYTIVENHVNSKLSIASWRPQSTRNMRSDFLERLFVRIGNPLTHKTKNKLLDELWDLGQDPESNIWEKIPSVNVLWGGRGQAGAAWRIRSDAWLCRFHTVEDSIYKCNRCGTVSHLSLRDVCPTYRCPGTLESISPLEEFSTNHYRSLYEHSSPVPIETKEHTAQITTQEGAERQRQFSDDTDPLNVLSCSTTFELGVDVGQLHAVFLRNVPPTIANYVQRAGRAGRRWGAAAFVLAFCRSRSHDLGYYDATERLVAGKVRPPRITIDNTRIARRHLHAVALSRFWRFHHPEMFNGPEDRQRGTAQWFFFGEPETGAQRVHAWLETRPQELEEEIRRIFPNSTVQQDFGAWSWATDLVRPSEDGAADAWEGSLGLAQTELRTELAEYERLQQDRPQLFNYAKHQLRRIRERQILGVLASRNVLPKYGFPVDVVPLKLQSKDEWAQRVELDRDLRIALSEYAPGCTLVANGKVIASYALERIPGKAWPEYRFAICAQCGKFHRSLVAQDEPPGVCNECGQPLRENTGTELEGTFVVPIFGFRTSLSEDGQEPVEVRPQRTYSTRVFFSHYRVAPQEPFLPEGSPDLRAGIQIQKRYSRYGMLTIVNPGRQRRGFWLCSFCGYGQTVASKRPARHKSPWDKPCDGKLRQVFLGHEFQSDVLELRFMGPAAHETNQGFWLSLTSALLAGAAKALDIERDDVDGTVLQFGGGEYRSLVLFDNVPGGAGHVRLIANKLHEVLQAAFEVTENCPGCSRDQSCSACLRNFRNQYAHDLLRRGPAADFLRRCLSGLYDSGNQDGYISLGLTDGGRWLEQQIRRANEVNLVLDTIPALAHEHTSRRNWYRILQEAGWRGTALRLFLRLNLNEFLKAGGPSAKAALHAITALTQLPHVEIYSLADQGQPQAQLWARIESEVFAVRWPFGLDPFAQAKEVEFSTNPRAGATVRADFEDWVSHGTAEPWGANRFEALLQGTKVISVPKGTGQSWKDILTPYIPDRIQRVEIYDRYIRNRYQFRSLDLFLDALLSHASSDGMTVKVITTCEMEERNEIQEAFRRTQRHADKQGIKLTYDIKELRDEMPHFRRVQIRSDGEVCSLWLDRGLDIFRFDNLSKPTWQTLETYVVVERK